MQDGVEANTTAVLRPPEHCPEKPKEATSANHIAKELFPPGKPLP
jgi:hypothetical protein